MFYLVVVLSFASLKAGILSRSHGEKSGEGLVPLLPRGPEMVDTVSMQCELSFVMMATCPCNMWPVQ